MQDVLQHRALRGSWPEVSLRRPLQPLRECVEEKDPHCACPGPGGTARRDRLWCSKTCRHRTQIQEPKTRDYWDVGPALEAARSFLEESFGQPNAKPRITETRIGIPRALTTHSLFPLYSSFFSALGMEVVLSAGRSAGRSEIEFRLLSAGADRTRRSIRSGAKERARGLPSAIGAHASKRLSARIRISARSLKPALISSPRHFPIRNSWRLFWTSPWDTRTTRR